MFLKRGKKFSQVGITLPFSRTLHSETEGNEVIACLFIPNTSSPALRSRQDRHSSFPTRGYQYGKVE
jgi:hypothetical protein